MYLLTCDYVTRRSLTSAFNKPWEKIATQVPPAIFFIMKKSAWWLDVYQESHEEGGKLLSTGSFALRDILHISIIKRTTYKNYLYRGLFARLHLSGMCPFVL